MSTGGSSKTPQAAHTHTRSHDRIIQQAKSGTARAALLGVSDGLVTNVSLILGVTAAGADAHFIRLAGLASLIAGAFSMAVGEYISMRGQVELLTSILNFERQELHHHPAATQATLQTVMEADGMTTATAERASAEVAADSEKAMAMYARGHLGINPDELGSAWGAAVSSFIMFSLGAAVALVPWLFTDGPLALALSLDLAATGAFGIGAYLGYTTGGHIIWPALRQLFVLIIAASATYLVGHLLGTGIPV